MIRFRMLLLMILFSPCPFRVAAQSGLASLKLCNKGSLTIDVATALSTTDILFRKNWEVKGWTRIPPGSCESVYSENTNDPAYIAFGFAGSTGARHAAQVEPKDQRKNYWGRPVFNKADKKFCVRADKFAYRSYDADPGSDCETLHVSSSDKGQYFAFPAALYFQPDGQKCYDDLPDVVRIESGSCAGGDYSLDILPTARDQVIVARPGSSTDKDQSPAEPSIGDAIIKALAKGAEENRKAQAALQPFVDACNAFFRDPANSGHRNPTAWCECLGDHYRGVMTSEEEARYANDFKRLFWNGIAEPRSTDPAWPRLHPAVNACAQ